jgi:putative inorganic carbon (HCO3(-)) transporter
VLAAFPRDLTAPVGQGTALQGAIAGMVGIVSFIGYRPTRVRPHRTLSPSGEFLAKYALTFRFHPDYYQKTPTYVQVALSVLLGLVLGGSIVLDVRLKLKIALVVALGFATLLAIVKPPRRLLVFSVASTTPLSVGKAFISSPDLIVPVGWAGVRLADALVMALLLCYLARLATDYRVRARFFPSTTLPALGWLIAGSLSFVNAKDLQVATIELIAMAKLFVLYLVVANSVYDEQDARWLLGGLLLALSFEALLGVYQGITGNYAGLSFLGEGSEVRTLSLRRSVANRCEGTVCYPNSLAMYLNSSLPFAMALIFSNVSKRYKRFATMLLGPGVLALILTLSRGGWISFVVAGSMVLALAIRRGRLKTVTAALIIGATFLLFVALVATGSNLIAMRLTSGDRGSAQSRIPLMKGALAILRTYPVLGAGLNNYTLYMPQYDPVSFHNWNGPAVVHNAFLLIGAETGLLGLAAFLWFLTSVMARAWRLTETASEDNLWVVGVGVLCGYVALSIHNTVDYALVGCSPMFTHFWFLAGMVAGLIPKHSHDSQT